VKKAMKILLLSDTYSEHTEKWAIGLAEHGIEVGLFSFNSSSYPWFEKHENITLLFEPKNKHNSNSLIGKLEYFTFLNALKKSIAQFKPDVVHAHYATSYGLIGALSGFHPFVISAWGTDVMKFPQKNFINKSILKYNLNKSDTICATSNTIKDFLSQITNKHIDVIPFGVDTTVFCKMEVTSLFEDSSFVIGCIKALESLYNVDVLIKAFSVLKLKHIDKSLKLLIIGVGSQENELKQLVKNLNLLDDVIFTGRIPFSEVSNYFNMIDVLANLSDYESFGVSVIESMACEKPVIATNTGGLKEIIENEQFGSLVEIGNVSQTAQEIEKYLLDSDLKEKVGLAARKKVIEKYNWINNVQEMISLYKNMIKCT
jgi:glycosyltransferase involved in cell wall biosynthesis